MPKNRVQSRLPLGDQTFPPVFHYLPDDLDVPTQLLVLAELKALLEAAPLFQQTIPKTGAPLSVRMSNAGDYGWVKTRPEG